LGQFLKSRRAISAGGAALILVVFLFFFVGGYFVWKGGLLGGTTTPSDMYQYYDPDLKQTLYFKTKAEMDAYIAKKIPSGVSGRFPISGKVLILGNGTAVTSITVEIYTPSKTESGAWDMIEAVTSDASTGAFTSSVAFDVGAKIMVHVLRSATKYTYDRWIETVVPPKPADLTASPLGAIFVWPYPTSTPTCALYTGAGAAVSTTQTSASYTSLSKASGAAQFKGYVQLNLPVTWSTFGMDPWTQPKTSKGHKLREYVTIITLTFNVTGISWQSADWTSISVSTGMKRAIIIRGTAYSPHVVSTKDTQPNRILIDTHFDMTALTTNTGLSVIVHILDYQIWDNTKDNAVTSTVGVNFGYTYDVTSTHYIMVTA